MRLGYSSEGGEITLFVLQLGYRLDDECREIVRFDHDPESEEVHDVTSDGVHMDSYRDGEKFRTAEIFPPMPASDASPCRRPFIKARRTLRHEGRGMARDQEPISEADFERLREDLEELREETAEALAEDLGGDPEDQYVGEEPVPDGGEE